MGMIDHIFVPVDAEIIKAIPLYSTWPIDRLTRHYAPNESYSVKSWYHFIRESRSMGVASRSQNSLKPF